MYKDKKIIGLITARAGSKGIPGKNIKIIDGKPLIAYTIETALQSKYLDKVIVSTDGQEIADISKKYKAEVPFLRPKHLAQDDSTSIDVVMHAIDWLEKENQFFDFLVLLEPTSPLRETKDIDDSIEMLVSHLTAKALVSVAKLNTTPPEFNVILNNNGFISKPSGSTDFKVVRRQDIGDLYFFEGTIFASEITELKKRKIFYHELTLGYVVDDYKAFGLDNPIDLIVINALIKAKKQEGLKKVM
jgi:N-acylneuraminate cytidylyltransferase/CMP-N,N'-diacetyllegionaminic acid synthase